MIPKIIHQTSETERLTWEERRLRSRLMALLPDWNYNFWDDNALDESFGRQFPEYYKMFKGIEKGIVRADLGRYSILYECGGFYFDTDYKLLKQIGHFLSSSCVLPVEEGVVDRGETNKRSPLKLGNAVLGSAPRFPFWRGFVRNICATQDLSSLNEGNPVLTTGPVALTNYWRSNHQNDFDITTPSKEVFYPNLGGWNLSHEETKLAVGVHLCWGSWRGKKGLYYAKNKARRIINAAL